MNIIITHPRSGSHLAGKIYNAEGFTAVRRDGPPFNVRHVVERIRTGNNVWFHYPFSQQLANFMLTFPANKYVLLRDPRDIIISIAYRVQDYPGTLVNYRYNGKRLSSYPFSERVDALIEFMAEPFTDFDKWRTSGAVEPIYYSDLVNDPIAKTYTDQLRKGVVGAYKREMTQAQIRKANQVYRGLIGKWKGNGK